MRGTQLHGDPMDILDTIVNREITAIGNAPALHIAHRWDLTIKANGVDIKPVYVKKVTNDRHYHKSYSEVLSITVGFIYGDYQYKILPYRDTLEASLIKVFLNNNANAEVDLGTDRKLVTYKVQLMDANSDAISGDNPLTVSKGMAAKSDVREVEIQLFTSTIDRVRKKSWGGTISNTDPLTSVAYLLLNYSKESSSESSSAVLGVDIDPSFQPSMREHLVLKPAKIVDLPMAIDKIVGGLHPAQMRFFLQGQHWHIYPIYDHSRFSTAEDVLTVIKIPKFRLPGIEKTFRMADGQVIVLSTNTAKHRDNSEAWQLNDGNGVRFVDADHIMDGFAKVGDNKAVADAKDKVTEVVFKPREDESDMVAVTPVIITNNYNEEYAKLALKSGAYVQVIWEHANINLLKPGMPVRYIFQDGEVTKEIYGTLNAVESLDYNTNNTITNPRFVTMALLTIFVSNASPMKQAKSPVTSTTVKTT